MRWFKMVAGKAFLAGLLAGVPFSIPSLCGQESKTLRPVPDPVSAQPLSPAEPLPPPGGLGTPLGVAPPMEETLDAPPAAAEGCGKDDCTPIPFWQKVPVVQKFPLPGAFFLPPTGPGYYSLADVIHGEYRKGPPKYGYPRFSVIPFSMFNVDWRYLDDPNNQDHDYFDFLKRIHLGDDWMFTTGGEFRFRYNNEHNSRLSGRDNNYNLERTRVYADLWYQDKVRVFVEAIDARTQNQNLPPLLIDQDYLDLLNAFIDVKLFQFANGPAYARFGRQELLYGSQRLISPLDFANTRRTFQGAKTFYRSDNFDFDLFCVQPVIPNVNHFDSGDNNQIFSGAWGTYRPQKAQLIDLYYLNLDNVNRVTQLGIQRGPINVSTVGSRYAGSYDGRWMWEAEGMFQFGSLNNRPILADADAIGGGYCFKDVPMKPQFWLYYEYASGDKNPNNGASATFQQLFPFGHYYFGGTDQIGRQNIHDIYGQFLFYPTNWITCFAQYHVLRLDSAFDALYNSAGNAIRRDATGRAGTDVGEVLNLVVNFHLDKHQDVFLQLAHLYSGQFIKKTGPPGDVDAVYLQYSYRW